MVIFGCILLILGIILFFIWRGQSNRLASIRSARNSTIADLTQIAEGVAQEIGAGSWKDYVKVRGKIQCDNPLHSQIQQTECVYYKTSVTREYEEVITQR
ncbi:MAG: E3 ubiquitin ligase, partial [Leptolyngbya sp. SIO3F4]|nr:E3 ubiquitin ligase [Leptolyngbya sp. SIO3F4]